MPVVLVTHDLDEAAMLADRIAVLYRGPHAAGLMDQSNLFRGRVQTHRPDRDLTLLDWGGRVLEARHAPHWPAGAEVDWMIPASHIVLHRRGRPSRGERENPVHGVIAEQLLLGETTAVTLQVDDDARQVLNFTLPTHAAERNGLAIGVRIGVSLLADGIHLMPPVEEY
jgi:molybdate transport system ATP-binding protein